MNLYENNFSMLKAISFLLNYIPVFYMIVRCGEIFQILLIIYANEDLIMFNRCLEEGAEEFFLKPVRLSDVSKLKPHMMKAKEKDIEKPEIEEKQENNENQKEEEEEKTMEIELKTTQSKNNSKRKSMEEGLSPERTRPRYNNGLTVMSS